MFSRVVSGVDGSAQSLAALRQAQWLASPGARIAAVTARELSLAPLSGQGADELAENARAAHETASRELAAVPGASARLVDARATAALLATARQQHADLLAIGAGGHGRATGILRRSVATVLLHEAPCPVLVARELPGDGFPRGIVVGVDGSPPSLAAAAVAVGLGARLGTTVRGVTATQDALELSVAAGVPIPLELDHRSAVTALTDASYDADLVVVGSRGLEGLRALGSISERVAHHGACSVLVVRPLARARDLTRELAAPDELVAAAT